MSALNRILARKTFKEMDDLERLIEAFGARARVDVLGHAEHEQWRYPLYSVCLGSKNPEDPVLAFFGGVHGLEKIGSEVVLSYMELILQLMSWDSEYQERLERTRLVFFPIVNPVGIVLRQRSNGNGVDLMRNAPLDAEEKTGLNLYCGHRISKRLPWYRGPEGAEMEVEAKALCDLVRRELFPSRLSLAMDVHSGFGARDRLWFPYAYSRRQYTSLAEVTALKRLFDRTYPHHFYQIEPVSHQYLIHGDLWDHLNLEFERSLYHTEKHQQFIPWTLEMGSWLWLRKNPRQILSPWGLFHPIMPHRHHRIMRRHITLFDFFHRALLHPDAWLSADQGVREGNIAYAQSHWYAKGAG